MRKVRKIAVAVLTDLRRLAAGNDTTVPTPRTDFKEVFQYASMQPSKPSISTVYRYFPQIDTSRHAGTRSRPIQLQQIENKWLTRQFTVKLRQAENSPFLTKNGHFLTRIGRFLTKSGCFQTLLALQLPNSGSRIGKYPQFCNLRS